MPNTARSHPTGLRPAAETINGEGIEHGLNSQALTALILLVAESAPGGENLMIQLIVNPLAGAS